MSLCFVNKWFFYLSDCFLHSVVPPVLALNQPSSNLSIGGSATLKCRISSVSRHATLAWTVDNVTYNTSGTFNTSRGQIVLSYSAFNSVDSCSKSSNLTMLNVSMDSEGIYTCTTIENNFVVKYNASLAVSSNTQASSSNSGEFFFTNSGTFCIVSAALIGGAATIYLLVLTGLGLTVVIFLSYRHLKTVQHRNIQHKSESKWKSCEKAHTW